ncbi:MAG: hypothetical protein KA603_16265, partial [Azonexus sp.]|nr:hypothetical protein [Azonexus sp.]MBP6908191.1 hypothetical protein [Azonexus sp.]
MSGDSGELGREELAWLFASLCGLYRVPFDAALLQSAHPPPLTRATLHEAARALGFRTGLVPSAGLDWQRLPLPALAFLAPGADAAAPPPSGAAGEGGREAPTARPVPILILKTDGARLLFLRFGQGSPETLPVAEV